MMYHSLLKEEKTQTRFFIFIRPVRCPLLVRAHNNTDLRPPEQVSRSLNQHQIKHNYSEGFKKQLQP